MMNKPSNVRQFEQPFGEKTRLVERQDFVHIAILVTIAFVIGVYLIATTVLITEDGTFYINQAQTYSNNPLGIIKMDSPAGYPLLILIIHKFITLFNSNTSLSIWIYCAQSVSLLCRLLSLISLYFIGKSLVCQRHTFLGLLILIILPYPAELGSDVIREWPHILFLSTGLLFLILACRYGRWQMFLLAGFVSGLGYAIREECAQIIIYGILWLLISLFFTNYNISRIKTILFILILAAGFALPTIPYTKIKGNILPPKLKTLISLNIDGERSRKTNVSYDIDKISECHKASLMPIDLLKAFAKLIERISENLMYFFMLPLILGLYLNWRNKKNEFDANFFIISLTILYTIMMILLYLNYDYISRRHCLPMVVFTTFYIPAGLTAIVSWICTICLRQKNCRKEMQYFYILLLIGVAICLPKLFKPMRIEKQDYRDAAQWLNKNTETKATIAVSDNRISFYAERQGLRYVDANQIPMQADYIVRIVKSRDEKLGIGKDIKEEYSTWVDKKESRKLVIYKVIR